MISTGKSPPHERQGIVGAITPQFGNSAPRNGWKIIEYEEENNIKWHAGGDALSIRGGRFVLNAPNGIACTLTGAHHYAGNITHPRQGFREMGVLEIYDSSDK